MSSGAIAFINCAYMYYSVHIEVCGSRVVFGQVLHRLQGVRTCWV